MNTKGIQEDKPSSTASEDVESMKTEEIQGDKPSGLDEKTLSDIENQLAKGQGDDPKQLKKSAAGESCCIFRVPRGLAKLNPNTYVPKVVSIGPYHHGRMELRMIEEHKHRYLSLFLEKAQEQGVDRSELFNVAVELEETIRSSYSEVLKKSQTGLVTMMILDGGFILMLFLLVTGKIESDDETDPILYIPWILPSIRSDLLLLENQVPFSFLEKLYERSGIGSPSDLKRMIFEFFNYSIPKPDSYWLVHKDVEANHLLDLIRKTFLHHPKYFIAVTKPREFLDHFPMTRGVLKIIYNRLPFLPDPFSCIPKTQEIKDATKSILSAKKLRLEGIKFRLSDIESELAIALEENKLKIPPLRLDGFMSSFFFNAVAYEQFYTKCSNHITSYVVFMGCLLDGEEDATFLTNEKRIIENYFGTELEVSQFFKKIRKDIAFDMSESYLKEVFEGVNEYTSRKCSGIWAEFRHTHFESPWTCLSSFAVVFVILLTATSALFAILSYLHDIGKIN